MNQFAFTPHSRAVRQIIQAIHHFEFYLCIFISTDLSDRHTMEQGDHFPLIDQLWICKMAILGGGGVDLEEDRN